MIHSGIRRAKLTMARNHTNPHPLRTHPATVVGRRVVPALLAVLAACVLAGFIVIGRGDAPQTYQATIDSAQITSASAELEVTDDGAILVADGLPEPKGS
jgi:hypothetical protein